MQENTKRPAKATEIPGERVLTWHEASWVMAAWISSRQYWWPAVKWLTQLDFTKTSLPEGIAEIAHSCRTMFNYLIRWPSWILTLKWNRITSHVCSQVLRKYPVTKLFQALNVLDADSWKWELAPVTVPLGCHLTMAWSNHLKKEPCWAVGKLAPPIWTAMIKSFKGSMVQYFNTQQYCQRTLWENPLESVYEFLISPICNWFLFWIQGYYKGQACFSEEAVL